MALKNFVKIGGYISLRQLKEVSLQPICLHRLIEVELMKRLLNLFAVCLLFALTAAASDLSGKRVAILGDSMTWIGGDSCLNERGWTCHFVNITHPSAVDIYARSGATWTNTRKTKGDTAEYSEVITDENVIYSQAIRLIDSVNRDSVLRPDIIFIYAGANDAWFSAKRPGIFDAKQPQGNSPSECTSLKTSVGLSAGLLKETFPGSRIILITPVEMTKVPASKINKVSDIIEDAGMQLGIEVMRADRYVDIRHDVETEKLRHTADGVHTNPSGARLIGEFVASGVMK